MHSSDWEWILCLYHLVSTAQMYVDLTKQSIQ